MPELNINAVKPYLICKIYCKCITSRLFIYGIVVSENEAFSSDDSAQHMEHDLGMNVSF